MIDRVKARPMTRKALPIPMPRVRAAAIAPQDTVPRGSRRGHPIPAIIQVPPADQRMDVLRDTLTSLVRRDGRDLTARQLTTFLAIYTHAETHTVSSLADLMNVSRPGVTRVMDRLVQFDLIAREEDREDRRRVLARRTLRGLQFFRELAGMAREASGSDVRSDSRAARN